MNARARPGRGAAPTQASATRAAPQQVRIIGGQWKRSPLPVATLPGLRPTPARVRETLFNWLGQDLTGWRCLDAFAGTGALGLEAASRGAAEVWLLEREARLVRQLREVAARLRAETVRVEQADALTWMTRGSGGAFDLVLLDPPFEAGLFEPALSAAVPRLGPGGYLYLEADQAWDAEALEPLGLALYRQGRAGQVHFHLFRRLAVGDPATD